jgi:hypothetical protein
MMHGEHNIWNKHRVRRDKDHAMLLGAISALIAILVLGGILYTYSDERERVTARLGIHPTEHSAR